MSTSPVQGELEDAVSKSQSFPAYRKRLGEDRDSPVGKMLSSFDFNLSFLISSHFRPQTFLIRLLIASISVNKRHPLTSVLGISPFSSQPPSFWIEIHLFDFSPINLDIVLQLHYQYIKEVL